jgi:2-O-methyltransferase
MHRKLERTFLSLLRAEYYFLKKRFDKQIISNEKINKNTIRQYLPQKPVIVDAGAHDGSDSVEMCRIFRGSKIYAFEPVPVIFDRLRENTKRYSRIKCYNLALSSQSGPQKLYVSSGTSDGSSSLLRPKDHLLDHPDVFFESEINVNTITLDDWASKEHISQVDFLWLDLQGSELEVLKASKKVLRLVSVVHMEVSTRMTYENVPLYTKVKEWMKEIGFVAEVEAIPEGWDMGNVLFVREKNLS